MPISIMIYVLIKFVFEINDVKREKRKKKAEEGLVKNHSSCERVDLL
jgi:hypothetical protein